MPAAAATSSPSITSNSCPSKRSAGACRPEASPKADLACGFLHRPVRVPPGSAGVPPACFSLESEDKEKRAEASTALRPDKPDTWHLIPDTQQAAYAATAHGSSSS